MRLAAAAVALGLATATLQGHAASHDPARPELVLQIGHIDGIWGLAVSPDGRLIATGGGNHGRVKLWDAASGLESRTFPTKWIDSLAFHPGGRWLAAGDRENRITIWNLENGREHSPAPSGGSGSSVPLTFSADGRWLVSGHRDGQVRYWDVASWTESRRLPAHGGEVKAVSLSRDGRWLASTDVHKAQVWNFETGEKRRAFEFGGSALSISPDGRHLAVSPSARDNHGIDIWNVETGERVRVIPGFSWVPWGMAFSADGRWFAAGGGSTLQLWETGKWTEVFTQRAHSDLIQKVAFSPDGRWLVSAGRDSSARMVEVPSGRELRRISGRATSVNEVESSRDGRWLVLASRGGFEPGDTALRVLDVAAGILLHRFADVQVYGPDNVEFSPDSASASAQYSKGQRYFRRAWDTASWREIETKDVKPGPIRGAFQTDKEDEARSADGRLRITASREGRVRIADAEGRELAVLVAMRGTLDWAVVAPDGLFDGTPDGMRQLVAWRFADNQTAPLEIFFNEFYHPGLLADLFAGRRPKAPRDLALVDRRQPRVELESGDATAGPVAARTSKIRLRLSEAPATTAQARGSGIRDVRLFRNGALVRAWRGDVALDAKGGAIIEASVPLIAGANRFTAYAFNRDNIKSVDAALEVRGADSLRRSGIAYILTVGINQYANRDFDLDFAVADARAIGRELAQRQAALGEFAKVEVVPLLDKEATKANILLALDRLSGARSILPPAAPKGLASLQPAQPEDAIFVYFAGHGLTAGARFLLVPHDLGFAGRRALIDDAAFRSIQEHAISDLELERAFERMEGSRHVLIIDACHSGQALEAEEKRRGPMNSKGLAQLAYEKGMYVLAAAQGFEAAMEVKELGHGLLTYTLVEEGLKTQAADQRPRDGRLDLREWLDFATLRVPQLQEHKILEALRTGRSISFVDGVNARSVGIGSVLQRPRVFYRRESEATVPLVARFPTE